MAMQPSWQIMNQLKGYARPQVDDSSTLDPLTQNQATIGAQNMVANKIAATKQAPKVIRNPLSMGSLPSSPGSGENVNMNITKDASKNEEDNLSKKNNYLSSDELRTLIGNVTGSEPYKAETGSIQDLKENLSNLANVRPKTQVDLSPLYQFVNYETHGQFQPPKTAPDTGAKYDAILEKYGKEVADKEAAHNKLPYDVLHSLVSGADQQKLLNDITHGHEHDYGHKPQANPSLAGTINPNAILQGAKKIGDDYSTNKASLDNIDGLLATGRMGDLGTVTAIAARALDQASARSMLAAMRTVAPRDFNLSAQGGLSYIGNNPNAPIPPEIVKIIKERKDMMTKNLDDAYQQKLKNFTQSVKAAPLAPGVDADAIIAPYAQQPQAGATASAVKSPMDMVHEKLDELLRSQGK